LEKRSDIAPFVGLRHDGVQELVSELMGFPKDEWVGTVGANVGYVLGEGYRWWEPPSEPYEVLQAIDSALDRLRLFLSLDALPVAFTITGAKSPSWRYNEIAILLFQGNRKAVLERIEDARAAFCQQRDEVCEQFEAFAQRVQERITAA
jgi:hypothetical protein